MIKTFQHRRPDSFLSRISQAFHELRFHPINEQFWPNVLLTVFVCFIQTSLIPNTFGKYIYIDLVTIWLVYTFVFHRFARSLIIMTIASIFLETTTTTPFSMYFCAYLLPLSLISAFREPISWHHFTPWFVTLISILLWVIAWEYAVVSLKLKTFYFNWDYIIKTVVRIVLSLIVGIILFQRWLKQDQEEHQR